MKYILILLSFFVVMACSPSAGELVSGNSSSTLSGSYATMLPINGFLYVINQNDLRTYNIANTEDPILIDEQNVGFEIESLYHYDGILFIGSSEALHIFAIQENGIPIRNSETSYNFEGLPVWDTCDPVVANSTHAFVTLRTSFETQTGCSSVTTSFNELRIFDITDLQEPELVSITEMTGPRGLALTGDHLFVCDGAQGVKLFDVSNLENPTVIWEDNSFESFDIILNDGLMMVVGPQSLRQYDYSDLSNIVYLTDITF